MRTYSQTAGGGWGHAVDWVSFVALLPKVEGVGTCRGAGVLRRFVAENSFVWLTALSGIPRAVWNTNVILLLYYYVPIIIQVIE